MGGTIPAGGWGAQYAAELRILLVYLSKSLGRLGQNDGGTGGATFFIGGRDPSLTPRRNAPGFHQSLRHPKFHMISVTSRQ